MVVDLNGLRCLESAHIKLTSEMMVRAFQDNPGIIYYLPDVSERLNKLRYFFHWTLVYGLIYGEVYLTSPNLEGVAVWLPSEKSNMSLWRSIRSGGLSMVLKVGIKNTLKVTSFEKYISLVRKHYTPFKHWYLYALAVDPDYQGKGFASTLLKPMLKRIDEENLPCYVETQDEKNVPIYQHYGFKILEESIITNTKVTNWAMLRDKVS